MHAHETHTREICAHEMHEIGRCGETFSPYRRRSYQYFRCNQAPRALPKLGYDDYQLGVRCIGVATRIEGSDRGQVQWTCGLDSLNRGAATQGPKTGSPAKELSQTQAPTQAYEAAAQVRSGAVHARRRTTQPQLRAAYSRLRLKQRVLRSEDRSAIW